MIANMKALIRAIFAESMSRGTTLCRLDVAASNGLAMSSFGGRTVSYLSSASGTSVMAGTYVISISMAK